MTKDELLRTLKEDLEVKKEVVALKAVKEVPADIPQYKGQAVPGMCALLGEILQEGGVWYVTRKNVGCFMSLIATGTCKNLPRDKYLKFMITQNKAYYMHKDEETVIEYYNKVDDFLNDLSIPVRDWWLAPLPKLTIPTWSFLLLHLTRPIF